MSGRWLRAIDSHAAPDIQIIFQDPYASLKSAHEGRRDHRRSPNHSQIGKTKREFRDRA